MKRARAVTLWACLLPVTSAMAQSIGSTTQPASATGVLPQITLASLSDVKISSYVSSSSLNSYPITSLPLNSPPIAGFQPQVVYGLTNEHTNGTEDAMPTATLGSPSLPASGQKFLPALLDSGSQSPIISATDAGTLGYNLSGANLIGQYTTEVVGLTNVPETVDISRPLGVYASGFGSATVNGSGTLSPGTTVFAGQTNMSVVVAESGSSLPSVIGAPVLAQYRETIRNSQPKHLTIGSQTFSSPQVEFGSLSNTVPAGYGTIQFSQVPSGFLSFITNPPSYFPDVLEGTNDPLSPTAYYSMLASTNLSHTGGSLSGKQFLFDTGAQVSVISVNTATQLGIFVGSQQPDFNVEVAGVGGTLTVPGYYVNNMSIATTTGLISWSHVPVLVINLPNPDDSSSNPYLDGVLGMNLFTDRDIVINDNYAAFSTQWQWNNSSGGTWGNSTNWTLALPSGQDTQANFYGAITSPKTITVDSGGFTVGTINFDNSNRYTINGPGRITLSTSVGQSLVNVSTGSHTINAPMTLANDTIMNVSLPASRLTITSDVTATGMTIFKQGQGVLEMKNVRSQGLTINDGTVLITANGGTNGTSRVSSLVFDTTLAQSAHLDLTNNAMVIDYTGPSPLPTIRQYLANGYNGGAWNGASGIESSMANATTFAIASAEKSTLGLTSFAGQSLSGPAVLIKYDYYGDANFDGHVDVADLFAVAQHYNTSGDVWTSGDFNYDGVVDVNDLKLFAQNWLAGAGNPLPGPALGPLLVALGLPEVDVPEPEKLKWMLGISLLALGGSRLRARRVRV